MVRLGAATWGIVDLVAITIAAGLMLGWLGAAAACAKRPLIEPKRRKWECQAERE